MTRLDTPKSRTEFLSKEQEEILMARYKEKGCKRSAERILFAHDLLAESYARKVRHKRIEFSDLIQEARLAMSEALEKFNPELGWRFSTLAQQYIKNALRRYVMDNLGAVRLGTNADSKKLFAHLSREINAYEVRHGQITDEHRVEIAEKLGVDLEDLRNYENRLHNSDHSLDMNLGKSSKGDSFIDMLSDDRVATEEDIVEEVSRRKVRVLTRRYMDSLSERDRLILEERYVREGVVRDRIAKKLGISKERVRQLEVRALGGLSKELGKHGIHSHSDV